MILESRELIMIVSEYEHARGITAAAKIYQYRNLATYIEPAYDHRSTDQGSFITPGASGVDRHGKPAGSSPVHNQLRIAPAIP